MPDTISLEATLAPSGSVVRCGPALTRFLGVPEEDLLGTTLDERAVGATQRTLARAMVDAEATGVEVGPVDLWLRDHRSRTRIGRFRVSCGAEGGFVLRGVDASDLPAEQQTAIVEALLREREASADPAGQLLRGTAELIEWRLGGVAASVGVLEDDGIVRHRWAPTLTPAAVERLDRAVPTSGIVDEARRAPSLRVFDDLAAIDGDLAEMLVGDGLSRLLSMRIARAGGGLWGMLAVLVPEDLEVDHGVLRVMRAASDIAASTIARRWTEQQLDLAPRRDELTGLPNRQRFLEIATEARDHPDRLAALFMVDLDDFRVANHALGHTGGDAVLVEIGSLLRSELGHGEVLGHFGGDVFLLLSFVPDVEAAVARAEAVRAELDTVVSVGGFGVRTRASVGVAIGGRDIETRALVRDADTALHRAKADGRDRIVLFEAGMRSEIVDRVALEAGLQEGIANHELELHYQPIVSVAPFEVVGVEALVRWRRSGSDNLVAPDHFVPLAEDVGLIVELGDQVLAVAVRVAASLRSEGWDRLTMSVNASPQQFTDGFAARVADALTSAALAPEALVLEITERSPLWDGAAPVIDELADMGVGLTIDDFGSGHAGLHHLRRFPRATGVKIDGAFVRDVAQPGSSSRAIVAASVALGHSLGMAVTAEGVETAEQLAALVAVGCDRAQGFLLSPPVTFEELPSALVEVVARAGPG